VFGLRGLTICDLGGQANSTTFVLTTNAAFSARECSFIGDGYQGLPVAIQCGGTDTSNVDNTTDSPFQGYGSWVRECFFDKISKAIFCRAWTDGFVFDGNIIWQFCGGADAPIEFDGTVTGIPQNSSVQNTISNNYIEMNNDYKYGIKLTKNANFFLITGNGWWDLFATTGLLGLYYIGDGCGTCVIIEVGARGGLGAQPILIGTETALVTLIDAGSAGTVFPQGVTSSIFHTPADKVRLYETTGVPLLQFMGSAQNWIRSENAPLSILVATGKYLNLGNDDYPVALRVGQYGTTYITVGLELTIPTDSIGSTIKGSAAHTNYLSVWRNGTNDIVASIRANGKMDVGGTSGTASIETGNGAPAGAANNGSLYLRQDGAAGTTLYVRENGSWVAK
jgi:hypothetical protein